MNPRERILKTLHFEKVDRPAYDLIEGIIWPEILAYFQENFGISSDEGVIDYLDPDVRWVTLDYQGPPVDTLASKFGSSVFSQPVADGPLSSASSVGEVLSYNWPDPAWWKPPDYSAARKRWPNHALAMLIWKPLFLTACDVFGMEGALIKLLTAPQVFEAAIRQTHSINMNILERSLRSAKGVCDICWLGDDFAGQQSLLMNPKLWRKYIKPYLAEEVALARDYGMAVLFHSCGSVRSVLPDLIEIGIDGLGVFQTTAAHMDVDSIASEFGGKMAFYGGIDVQQLLSFGSIDDVEARVRANVASFSSCGGYIVANSHRVSTIKGENLVAMCRTAASITL